MMSARSTPNLQQPHTTSSATQPNHTSIPTTATATASIYTYLHSQNHKPSESARGSANRDDDSSPPPTPPVRDASSLRSIKYGPGHEKFPSWPVPAAAEAPLALRGPPSGGSHRSKSWTDHTNYPKEKVVTYTRPYMKRQHSYNKQLKTVMERCEKIPAETFESRLDKMSDRLYFPRVDREGKALGDLDYMVPSPPERDISKPQLTQADLEDYARSYQDTSLLQTTDLDKYGSQSYQDITTLGKSLPHLTQADLEEYTRTYEEALSHQHQKQPSYAQSEGYHSYVSSTDSTATPFLDRLRRDSEVTTVKHTSVWDEASEERDDRDVRNQHHHEGRDSVVTTSSGSVSSSETLKWHGSMSDVSVASSSCTHLANSSSSRQLIAHSARVQTPQKHNSESVLYIGMDNRQPQQLQDGWKDKESRNNHHNQLKLFPVNTYTVQPSEQPHPQQPLPHRSSLASQTSLSVADRINELERQTKYTYLDPEKKHRVSDPTLKAIQKKALLSYYERQHSLYPNSSKSSWRSEPQLAQSAVPQTAAPQPPPRPQPQTPSRRASCASDYASSVRKGNIVTVREAKSDMRSTAKHQHSNSCSSLSTDLLGPVIMGPAISVDDWVPERPPKNPHLRSAFPDLFQESRIPSPDLPPPSPPTVLEDEVVHNDDPLPPPPLLSEMENVKWVPQPDYASIRCQANGLPSDHQVIPPRQSNIRMSQRHQSRISHAEPQVVVSTTRKPFPEQGIKRSHPHKLIINGSIAVSQKVTNGLPEPFHTEALRSYKPPPQIPLQNNENSKQQLLMKPPAQLPAEIPRNSTEFRSMQRSSVSELTETIPPPLHPRKTRINQSMRARIPDRSSHGHPKSSPPKFEDKRDIENRHPNFISKSQSKASYLAARREREHGLSTDIGSYKRTMSPSGDGAKELDVNPWPVTRTQPVLAKDNTIRNNINNNNLLRRASLAESKCSSKDPLLTMVLKPCDEEKKQQCNLPDVLPVNAKAKTSPTRSHFIVNGDKSVTERERFSPPKIAIQRSPSLNSPSRNSPVLDGRHRTDRDSPRNRIRESPPNSKAIRSSPIKTSPINSPRISLQSSPILPSPLQMSPKTSPYNSPRLTYSPPISPAKSPVINNETAAKALSPEPKVIEGLQLIQRTEITLRVNTCTIDAASQTEKEELPCTPLPMRKKLQEEIECERLSQDLASHLSPSDRLKGILVPGPEHKKPTDYVSGLFRVDVTSKPRPLNSPFRSRNNTPNCSPPPSMSPSTSSVSALEIFTKTASTTTTEIIVPILEPTSPLSGTSAYFTTSESKAKFLTRYSRDMNQYNIVKDTKDLNQKKEELVNRLDKKLEVLRGELLVVSEEGRTNDELGENVERHVARVARPHEAAKFRLHVEEVGKITSLLLGLSGRLARAENALMGLPPEDAEKKILENKRDKLLEQLEEAKKLKESIDKRSVIVSNILYKYLNSEEYADYDHFINMKAKLIMDSREISDKIKLGEEQLCALKETLAISD